MARLDQLSTPCPALAADAVDRLRFVGYSSSWSGENIAYNYRDASAVVAGWIASPGRRANVLSPDYTEIGVVGPSAAGASLPLLVFGRPL